MNITEINYERAEQLAEMLLQEHEFRTLMCYYQGAMMEVETKLKVLNESLNVTYDRNPIESIKCRLKEPKSIIEKLWRKKYPISLESMEQHIRDVAGVRVICAFRDDVYLLAEFLLKQDDIELVGVKDYIKNPKENGYRSLHLIVKVPIFLSNEKRMMNVEVQLRTIAMDFWASLEHKMRYKKDLENADEIGELLSDCATRITELDTAMQNIRDRIDGRDT